MHLLHSQKLKSYSLVASKWLGAVQRRPSFMEEELHPKVKRLIAIEMRSRLLVNALLRERGGCVRASTDQDVDKAIDSLMELFELDRNYWKR